MRACVLAFVSLRMGECVCLRACLRVCFGASVCACVTCERACVSRVICASVCACVLSRVRVSLYSYENIFLN